MDVGLIVLADGGFDIEYSVVPKRIYEWVINDNMPGRVGKESSWAATDTPQEIQDALVDEPEGTLALVTSGSFWNDKAIHASLATILPANMYALHDIMVWLNENNYNIIGTFEGANY